MVSNVTEKQVEVKGEIFKVKFHSRLNQTWIKIKSEDTDEINWEKVAGEVTAKRYDRNKNISTLNVIMK